MSGRAGLNKTRLLFRKVKGRNRGLVGNPQQRKQQVQRPTCVAGRRAFSARRAFPAQPKAAVRLVKQIRARLAAYRRGPSGRCRESAGLTEEAGRPARRLLQWRVAWLRPQGEWRTWRGSVRFELGFKVKSIGQTCCSIRCGSEGTAQERPPKALACAAARRHSHRKQECRGAARVCVWGGVWAGYVAESHQHMDGI